LLISKKQESRDTQEADQNKNELFALQTNKQFKVLKNKKDV
jgi:hypothetical protein